jgi:hypothetical protein
VQLMQLQSSTGDQGKQPQLQQPATLKRYTEGIMEEPCCCCCCTSQQHQTALNPALSNAHSPGGWPACLPDRQTDRHQPPAAAQDEPHVHIQAKPHCQHSAVRQQPRLVKQQ